jgi:hypothetical protein
MLNSSKKISELQTKIGELETQLTTAAETHKNELDTRDVVTEELSTAHANAVLAKETEIVEIKGQLTKAQEDLANATKDTETKIEAEVVKRCAAAGLSTPIKRDPEVNTETDLVAVREQIAASTDPKERAELARKARELRNKRS